MHPSTVKQKITEYVGSFLGPVTRYADKGHCIEIQAGGRDLSAQAESSGGSLNVVFMADDSTFDSYSNYLSGTKTL